MILSMQNYHAFEQIFRTFSAQKKCTNHWFFTRKELIFAEIVDELESISRVLFCHVQHQILQ
jgi:hypothetical protein